MQSCIKRACAGLSPRIKKTRSKAGCKKVQLKTNRAQAAGRKQDLGFTCFWATRVLRLTRFILRRLSSGFVWFRVWVVGFGLGFGHRQQTVKQAVRLKESSRDLVRGQPPLVLALPAYSSENIHKFVLLPSHIRPSDGITLMTH